jgi:tRNA-splicing ligase RtcB
MDTSKFQRLSPYEWTQPIQKGEQRAGIRLFADQALLAAMDDKVLEQVRNVAKLPGLVGEALTMPDAHWGYGFPIGGVAAFDAEQGGVISAGGVGFDISCGIRCLRSNLTRADIAGHARALADTLFHTIPAGVGEGGELRLSTHELEQVMVEGAHWAVARGFGTEDDLIYVEEQGKVAGARPSEVSLQAMKRQLGEMGTLGSGNHYLEVQVVDEIFDSVAARAFGLESGRIVISIHCGSRGLGHQVGTDYLLSLAKAASRLGITLPDRELACAPILSPEGQAYLGAMNSAINCALANRQILAGLTRQVFSRILPGSQLDTLFDVSHNTCKRERHLVDGQMRELYIHRKGATRAFGPGHPALPQAYREVGQPVIIGGSMGTGSYILAGNPEEQNHAFASASHGAGRAMSRHQALHHWQGRQLVDELAARGILIRSISMRGVAEEAPGAYKDVEQVADVTQAAGLARKVARLRPLICIKG